MTEAVEYHGSSGGTASCLRAIERLILCGTHISNARLLTSSDGRGARHAFLLAAEHGPIAIRASFTSGYRGAGPLGLARALTLLRLHRIEVGDIPVSPELLQRLDSCALSVQDLEWIDRQAPDFGDTIHDHIVPFEGQLDRLENPWRRSMPDIPYPILDDRLLDLAIVFWNDPDAALLKAFRRLETIVAKRLEDCEFQADQSVGAKLFGKAFNGDGAPLIWPERSASERIGCTNMFVGTFGAFRNARAHREEPLDPRDAVIELLAVNHLYLLEAEAVPAS